MKKEVVSTLATGERIVHDGKSFGVMKADGKVEPLEKGTITTKQGVKIHWTPEDVKITYPEQETCPVCGEKFRPKRKDQTYCSAKCRTRVGVRAHRARKRGMASVI